MSTWTELHRYYPKARLRCFRYTEEGRVPPEIFDVEVLKMMQEYRMNAHFDGPELERLRGSKVDELAIQAVQHVQPFLITILN